MSKQRKSRIEPYDVTLKVPRDGHLVLIFEDAKSKVSIAMPRWWVSIVAGKLHEFVDREQKNLDQVKKDLRGA